MNGRSRRRLHPPLPPLPAAPPDHPGTVRRAVGPGGPVVVKRRGGDLGDRLLVEAEVLRAVGHPGAPDLLDVRESDGAVELELADVGSRTMAEVEDMPVRTAVRALVESCRTVASLHAAGWSHGEVRPEHLVVGGRGTVRLCSWAAARPAAAEPGALERDVTALVRMAELVADRVTDRPGDRHGRRTARRLAEVVAQHHEDAASLAEAVARCTAPTSSTSRHRDTRSSQQVRRRAVLAPAAVLAVLVGARSTFVGAERPTAGRGPAVSPTPAAPTVSFTDAVVRAGRPGDLAIAVDDPCLQVRAVVVLRPSTGEVFVQPWSTDRRGARAVLADRVARAVDVTLEQGRSGCPTPVVRTDDGQRHPVALVDGPRSASRNASPATPRPSPGTDRRPTTAQGAPP